MQIKLKKIFLLAIIVFLFSISFSNMYYKIYPKDWRNIINEVVKEKHLINKESYSTTIKEIKYLYENKSKIEFLEKSAILYSEGITYAWPDYPVNMLTISPFDNWILYFSKFLDPVLENLNLMNKNTKYFQRFESYKYERALGRGFGLCSQNALGLADLLYSKYNIKAKVISLGIHIIIEVKLNDNFYILDPSIGVFMPFSLNFAFNNLDEVEKYYNKEIIQSKISHLNFTTNDIIQAFNKKNYFEAHNFGSSNYYQNYYKMIAVKYYEIISDILSIIIPLIICLLILRKLKFFEK
ncbi:MAG: hypothetical protein CMP16_00735 [Rickettsiales bacterium]|nr:hypothetical protein [Rickettsiales bacterium]|tara:strand:+ start:662 stop:1549 length:888 start_codon:yes stop_codon:yes gene_type:complete